MMREAEGNPIQNRLGAGIKEEDLAAAVAISGHPMQARVAKEVRRAFLDWGKEGERHWYFIQEEWTYQDSDTGGIRALDALAELSLWDSAGHQPRVRPTLNLLIECKQSELPYVFFTRRDAHGSAEYPYTGGFPHEEITLTTNDDPSSFIYPLLDVLGLRSHAFLNDVPVAVSLSKARRKGKELEITGEDSYNSLTLPLLKARDHLFRIARFRRTYYTDGRLVTAVAVVNAPMIAVDEDGGLQSLPWVRVHRYEPTSFDRKHRAHHLAAYDVVHEHYLSEYLAQLCAFAGAFSAAELGHGKRPDNVSPHSSATRAVGLRLLGKALWRHLRDGKEHPSG
jgi:hypothetical protein